MPDFQKLTVDKFTFKVVLDRFYTPQGVWALAQGSLVRIGLSDFLQQRSGDIAFADLKPVGSILTLTDDIGIIETIKVNIDLKSPAAGVLAHVNSMMETAPELINQDPYGAGWLCEIDAADWVADQKRLLSAADYYALIKQEVENEARDK